MARDTYNCPIRSGDAKAKNLEELVVCLRGKIKPIWILMRYMLGYGVQRHVWGIELDKIIHVPRLVFNDWSAAMRTFSTRPPQSTHYYDYR